MNQEEKQQAKLALVKLMQAGVGWQEAAEQVGIAAKRSSAYDWWQKYRELGEEGLRDGRHGHVCKGHEAVVKWLIAKCQESPEISSSQIKEQVQEHFGVSVSVTHLNRIRARHGVSRQARKKNRERSKSAFRTVQEGSC